MLTLGLATLAAVITSAQQAPTPAPEPAKPVLTLDCDAAVITVLIKPDKTADLNWC